MSETPDTSVTERVALLLDRLNDEAETCRLEGAFKTANLIDEAHAAISSMPALEEENARLREALREMVYETTHLSPEQDDGSHWCKISGAALAQARAALSPRKEDQ